MSATPDRDYVLGTHDEEIAAARDPASRVEFVSLVIDNWRASGGEPDIAVDLPAWLDYGAAPNGRVRHVGPPPPLRLISRPS